MERLITGAFIVIEVTLLTLLVWAVVAFAQAGAPLPVVIGASVLLAAMAVFIGGVVWDTRP